MAVGDLNGDGKPDIVTPNPREVGVLLNAGDEKLGYVEGMPVMAEAPFAVTLTDLNGDKLLDLIAASDEGSPLVEIFIGNGEAGFTPAGDSPIRFMPGGKKIVVGDFNDDGIQDAVVASYEAEKVLVIFGGRAGLQTGYLPSGEHPWGLAAADLNEDGKDDLVITDDVSHQAIVYLSISE